MDIQIFGNDTLKIKSKKATLAIDPKPLVQKFDADAVLVIDKNCDPSRVNESRIILDGVGEYEISGLKISGLKSKETMYVLSYEGVDAVIAKASSLENLSADKVGEYKIVIINADADLNQSIITAMEPSVVVLYGEKKKELAKILGKENALLSSKITIMEDKLPEEMDVMLLG